MSLDTEILESIKKNLPEHVGTVLKNELAELERLRKIEKRCEQLEKDNQQMRSMRVTYDDTLKLQSKMDEREKALDARERDMKVAILEIKLEEANKRSEIGKGLVETIFKSPVIMRTLNGSLPVGVGVPYPGGSAVGMTAPANVTETVQTQ